MNLIPWLLIPGGIAVIVYSIKIGDFIGEIDFAEKMFGRGGTFTLVKLLGLCLSVFSIVWLTGDLPRWMQSTFGVFFGGS